MLKKNIRRFGQRVRMIAAGLWFHPTTLVLSSATAGSGNEWDRRVRERKEAEAGGIPAIDIPTMLAESGHRRTSILKIDIEGSEAVVFSGGHERWLDLVVNLVVELHVNTPFGPCSDVFHKAVEGRGFAISRSCELTVCKRK